EGDGRRVVKAVASRGEKSGVSPGAESKECDGLLGKRGKKTGALNFDAASGPFPGISGDQSGAVGVAHLQGRIVHRLIEQPGLVQTWPKPADNNIVDTNPLADGEPGNEHVVTGAGKGARGDVGQF